MKLKLTVAVICLSLLCSAGAAWCFCGFYVAKAGTKLFNKASKVVLVRNDDKTVLTMVNDFQGDLKEFAVVIPVPTFIERGQIHVGDRAVIDHLDAYSAPRLVEYFDEDPCRRMVYELADMERAATAPAAGMNEGLGVTVEAEYTVGEYDILILSAKESSGLETWLIQNDYKIPEGASRVLGSYIKQNMRFFVAKVNLEEQAKLGYTFLRPLQVAYETPKFILPIRLGTVNADGPQELFIFAITRNGRIETTNYRTVKLPSNLDVPIFVKDTFADFYRDMFDEQVRKENMNTVFLEYAWNMAWCDPCAADPLSQEELRELGVFWLAGTGTGIVPRRPAPVESFITRLHVRYDADHFPEDLVFQETGDKQSFQGRYILRHPWYGDSDCEEARQYREQLHERHETEAQTLASLTGWEIGEVRNRMDLPPSDVKINSKWWEKIWED